MCTKVNAVVCIAKRKIDWDVNVKPRKLNATGLPREGGNCSCAAKE